jgi:hypothetical protein
MQRVVWLLWLAGCGAASETADLAVGDAAMGPIDLALPDSAHSGPCTDDPSGPPDGAVCITTVAGTTVDEDGGALSGVFVTYCAGECFFAQPSDSTGAFHVDVRSHVVPSDYSVEIHGRPDRVSYYVTTPPPSVSGRIDMPTPLPVPPLPANGPAIALDQSQQSPSSGDVTLLLAQGTKVMLDPADVVNLPAGGQLRVWRAPNPAALPFIDPGHPPDVLYSLAPFEAIFSVKTPLRFANSAGLPANAAVDVLAQRSLLQEGPPAGPLLRVAGARVSSDGTTIDFDSGAGVTLLDWIALVKK